MSSSVCIFLPHLSDAVRDFWLCSFDFLCMEWQQNKCTELWKIDRVKVSSKSRGLSFLKKKEQIQAPINNKKQTTKNLWTNKRSKCVCKCELPCLGCFVFLLFHLFFLGWAVRVWCLSVVSQWDLGPSHLSPGEMLLSTKPAQIQWNWAELQHLCTAGCCWPSLLLLRTWSSGPSALLQRGSTVPSNHRSLLSLPISVKPVVSPG